MTTDNFYLLKEKADSCHCHETSVPTLRCTIPDGTKTSVFEPKFIGNSATDYKWDVRMFYKFDEATATVKYNVFLKDNFSKTHYVYVYQGSFWVPQFEKRAEFAGVTDSREIKLSGLPMTEDTFKTYGYTTDELENVKIFYDKTMGIIPCYIADFLLAKIDSQTYKTVGGE